MNATCSRSILFSVIALGAAACTASAAGPVTEVESDHPAIESSATAGPPLTESERVDQFLGGLYRSADVRHSFHSADGRDIDCVDFAAEPAVRKRIARGQSLEDIRAGNELSADKQAYNATARKRPSAFAGDPDEEGRIRACADGTVAHAQITKGAIASAGGLDAYLAHFQKKPVAPNARPFGPNCPYPTLDDYQWITTGWADDGGVANQGGQATMAIAQPTIVAGTGDHSLAETWLIGSSGCNVQTVEAGWTVDEGVNDGDVRPHVFIFSTASTYGTTGTTGATGCYNNIGANCVDFVPDTSLASLPALTPGEPGGAQHEMAVSTTYQSRRTCHSYGGRIYCVTVDIGWQVAISIDGAAWESLGYYPADAYGTGPLATGATAFQVGTEVENSIGNAAVVLGSPNVTMGEGPMRMSIIPQTNFFGYQSYFHDYSLVSPASVRAPDVVEGDVGVGENDESCATYGKCVYNYTAGSGGNPGASSWANWFYYGDYEPILIYR